MRALLISFLICIIVTGMYIICKDEDTDSGMIRTDSSIIIDDHRSRSLGRRSKPRGSRFKSPVLGARSNNSHSQGRLKNTKVRGVLNSVSLFGIRGARSKNSHSQGRFMNTEVRDVLKSVQQIKHDTLHDSQEKLNKKSLNNSAYNSEINDMVDKEEVYVNPFFKGDNSASTICGVRDNLTGEVRGHKLIISISIDYLQMFFNWMIHYLHICPNRDDLFIVCINNATTKVKCTKNYIYVIQQYYINHYCRYCTKLCQVLCGSLQVRFASFSLVNQ
jgi:hypothetical protein